MTVAQDFRAYLRASIFRLEYDIESERLTGRHRWSCSMKLRTALATTKDITEAFEQLQRLHEADNASS